mgnify:CR=1 FL=1
MDLYLLFISLVSLPLFYEPLLIHNPNNLYDNVENSKMQSVKQDMRREKMETSKKVWVSRIEQTIRTNLKCSYCVKLGHIEEDFLAWIFHF